MARRGGTGGRFPDGGRGNDPGRRGGLAVVLAIAAALAPVVGGIAVPGGVGTAAGASTLVVDADGGGDYTTIQAAVDDASTGDVVEVRAGTYNESVTVNASITIRGADATLDGSGLNDSAGIVIRGGDPTIAGLTIRGYDFDGVLAFDGGFTLDGIVAVDNEQSGVDAFKVGSDDWTITGATLDGNGFDGLSVTDATGTWRVESATIRNNGDDGIDVDRENTSGGTWTVVDTTVANNAQNGVEAIATTADWTISGGRFSGNGDDGIDTGGSRGTWTVTGVRAVGNAENGIEAVFTTGDWRVENAEVVDSGIYGVTANTSSGNWTVTGTTIDGAGDVGLRATAADGNWLARDLTVSGTTVGVNAAGADRAWRVERFRASDVVLGVQTDFADGDWTVRDATITATVAGVDATDSNGAWRVVDTEITTGGFAGVYAFEADGAWTVGDTTIRDAENGIYAGTTGGDWTIRDSTLGNYTVGVNATNSTGAWAVGNSVLDAAGPNVTDVDGGEGGPTGDATGNWWGGTVAAPDPPDCTGNVDCSDPLSGPPGGGDGEDTGDANLSVSVGSATVRPGANATVDLTFEAGTRSLNRTGAFVAVDPPVAPDGWPFVGVTAERGIWNDRAFVVANVSADETVNASFTVAVPLDTPPGRYGITVLPSYVIGEDSTAVPPANATVTVDEPPVSLEGANITLPPGGRGRLNLTVTNNELSERFASVSIERLPANVSVVEYVAGGGIWLPGSGVWGGDVPAVTPPSPPSSSRRTTGRPRGRAPVEPPSRRTGRRTIGRR